jgi:hypothetical protein
VLAVSLLVGQAEALAGRAGQPGRGRMLLTSAQATYHAALGNTARSQTLTAQVAAWRIDALLDRLPAGTGWNWPLKVVPNPIGRGCVNAGELRGYSKQLVDATTFLSRLDKKQAAALPPALQGSVQQLADKTRNLTVECYALPRRNGTPDLGPTEAANAFLGAACTLVKTARGLGWVQ